jgi:ArsR family transcriptional regulator, cadmium/lead-responsive transcriptional repressor
VQSARFRLPATLASTELVANYFPALGDPTRRRILGLLPAQGELAAGEVTRQLGQPQPMVSHHLVCLRWCGFVTTRRQHRVVYYRLADPRVAAMLGLAQGLLDDHAAACYRILEA